MNGRVLPVGILAVRHLRRDGGDDAMVRRGNTFIIRGQCGRTFTYGDPGDTVLVGNWYGALISPQTDPRGFGKGGSLTVQRANRFFVRTDLTTGAADYTFLFGDPGDEVLVGDWITRDASAGDGTETIESGNGADQLAIRRGFTYHQSSELADAAAQKTNPITTQVFDYGDPDDAVFVASLPTPVDENGQVTTWDTAVGVVQGDGLGVRRFD
jgi:hypothetical protein